jgi:acetyl esterase/lipase
VRAALTPVVLAALFLAAGCGGGGGGSTRAASYPTKETIHSANTEVPNGVWTFLPAGKPKRLVIFFHGQGGVIEATPQNHRAWIDHLVKRGAIVVYPRYEIEYSQAVIDPAIQGIQTADRQLSLDGLPVLALGYSRGAAMAVEYAALAARRGVPEPDAIETVNPVPYGETARVVNLKPIRPATILAILISDKDPHAIDGSTMLLNRLRDAGFPGKQIELDVAHSRKGFVADHLAPLSTAPAARKAYWSPTDSLLTTLQ